MLWFALTAWTSVKPTYLWTLVNLHAAPVNSVADMQPQSTLHRIFGQRQKLTKVESWDLGCTSRDDRCDHASLLAGQLKQRCVRESIALKFVGWVVLQRSTETERLFLCVREQASVFFTEAWSTTKMTWFPTRKLWPNPPGRWMRSDSFLRFSAMGCSIKSVTATEVTKMKRYRRILQIFQGTFSAH